jgi:four helix bundle protein
MNSRELEGRLKQFAFSIVKLCNNFHSDTVSSVIQRQLIRSAFSAAANYRAATRAQSPKSFCSKLSISYEEIDESLFWLECIFDLKIINSESLENVRMEADELVRILGASRKTIQSKLRQNIK